MYKKVIFWVVALISIMYGTYSLYVFTFDHPSPTIIKAEGIVLDTTKTYFFSNYDSLNAINSANEDDIILNYSERNLYPNLIGNLEFIEGNWVYITADCITNPYNSKNPFLPFTRNNKKNGDEFVFYDGASHISEQSLKQGIITNFPSGRRHHRINIKLNKLSDVDVLIYKDDGLGVEYMLPKGLDTIGINFNSRSDNNVNNYNFNFDNTSTHYKNYKLAVNSTNFSNSFRLLDEKNSIVESGDSSFQIGGIYFKITQRYPTWQKLLFVTHLILLIISIIFYYFVLFRKNSHLPVKRNLFGKKIEILREVVNPIHQSLIWLRFLITSIAFLGVPLLIIAFNFNSNSNFYSVAIIMVIHLLPATLVFIPIFWSIIKIESIKLGYVAKILSNPIWGFVLLGIVLVIFFEFSSNERVLGMPSLHLQKLALVISFFLFNSGPFKGIVRKIDNAIPRLRKIFYIPNGQNILVIIYSLLLTVVSSDFGSLLFVLISVLILELLANRSQYKKLLFTLFSIIFCGYLLVQVFHLKERKFYRVFYTYWAPDNSFYDDFNQADRESISYIYTNLKNISNKPSGYWNDLLIPKLAHSVAHSDYAFHWSLMIGGVFFIVAFLILLFFLLYHFFFIIKVTSSKVKINKNEVYNIAETSLYGRVISFLAAITLLQFIYQVFTNLMLPGAVLTGQPLTYISVGFFDGFFLAIFFILLDGIFNNEHIGKIVRSKALIQNIPSLRKSRSQAIKISSLLTAFIVILITVKIVIISSLQNDEIVIEKRNKSEMLDTSDNLPLEGSYPNQQSYNQALIDKAITLINNYKTLSMPNIERNFVRNLQSLYYSKKNIKEYYNSSFKLNVSSLEQRSSYNHFFKFDDKLISGDVHPFGEVYGKQVYSNGEKNNYTNNVYYATTDWSSKSINLDLNAELNKSLESHISEELGSYDIQGTVLILNNTTREFYADANFPFFCKTPTSSTSYFVGSVKKGVLAYCLLKLDPSNIRFQYNNSRGILSDINYWIRWSDNDMSAGVLKHLVENNSTEFNELLEKDFNLPFFSLNTTKFSDLNFEELIEENNISTYKSIAIGGVEPYQPVQVSKWYGKIANEAFNDNTELKEILNSPLDGTAISTRIALQNNNLDPKDYIAKTGTFEDDGINISSSFVISNKEYTVLVVLNGKQPSNANRKSAIYLFNDSILPLLVKYNIF